MPFILSVFLLKLELNHLKNDLDQFFEAVSDSETGDIALIISLLPLI